MARARRARRAAGLIRAADGRRSGGGAAASGQGGGGAGEVVGDGGAGQPGVVGGEPARGQVREGPVDELGVDLLDHRVVAVLCFGLDEGEWAVGERCVVAPGGEQFRLGGDRGFVRRGRGARSAGRSPRPGGCRRTQCMWFRRSGRREVERRRSSSQTGLGILDLDPRVIGDGLARGADLLVHPAGDREPDVAAAAGGDHLAGVERRVRPAPRSRRRRCGLRGRTVLVVAIVSAISGRAAGRAGVAGA